LEELDFKGFAINVVFVVSLCLGDAVSGRTTRWWQPATCHLAQPIPNGEVRKSERTQPRAIGLWVTAQHRATLWQSNDMILDVGLPPFTVCGNVHFAVCHKFEGPCYSLPINSSTMMMMTTKPNPPLGP
jgi:hypothetical protein